MRLLFLGDMVGKTGRTAVWERLPGLISDLKLDFVIVNGENAAGGFGITEDIFLETVNAGADVVTTGNHVWDQKEAVSFCTRHDQFLRPANYPAGTPGKGSGLFYARNGARVLVANIMGRVFMHPELDDPFKSAESILAAAPLKEQADVIVFDFHAEATSEKQCFGHFVDGLFRKAMVLVPLLGKRLQAFLGESTYRVGDLLLLVIYQHGSPQYRHSTAMAVASPPPMQMAATPRRRLFWRKADNRVTRIRAPEAPIG